MIDYTTVRKNMEQYLKLNFSECDVVYQNKQPKENVSEFIILHDTIVDSNFAALGSSVTINQGLLTLVINTPLNTGSERSRKIGSILSSLLSGLEYESITFSEAELHDMPIDNKSVFFQQSLQIPYTFAYGSDHVNNC